MGGVPGFWLRVLQGCEECEKAIKERDEEALLNLTHIEWDVQPGEALLSLHFAKNDFFSNKTLMKKFPSLEGSTIEWFEGKNLTRKAAIDKGGKGKKGKKSDAEAASKGKATASFFQLFNTPEEVSKYVEQQQEMVTEI